MITSAGEWDRSRRRKGGDATPAFSWVRAGDWAPPGGAPACAAAHCARLTPRAGGWQCGPGSPGALATPSGSRESRWVDRLVLPPQPHPRARTLGASWALLRSRRVFLNSLPSAVDHVGPSEPSPSLQVVRVGWSPSAAGLWGSPCYLSTSRPDLAPFSLEGNLN